MSQIKEPHFFSNVPIESSNIKGNHTFKIKNKSDYLQLFSHKPEAEILGESSPSYLWDLDSCENIYNVSPQAKIIIILRDPIARVYSQYQSDLNNGLSNEKSVISAVEKDRKSNIHIWGVSREYLQLSHYYEGITKYQRTFGPENVEILFYESFFDNPNQSIKALISDFLKLKVKDTQVFREIQENKTNYSTTWVRKLKKGPFIKKIGPSKFGRFMKNKFADFLPDSKISNQEILHLFQYLKSDLKKIDQKLGINFYTDYYRKNYGLSLSD